MQDDKALPIFKKIVDKDTKNGPAWYQIGSIYSRKNMTKESNAAYKKADEAISNKK